MMAKRLRCVPRKPKRVMTLLKFVSDFWLGAFARFRNDSASESLMEAIKQMAEDIENAFCENSKQKLFLPYDKLNDFVKEKKIYAVFGTAKFFASMKHLVDFIQQDAPQLFLILVLMESNTLEQQLKSFQKKGFNDGSLPINFDQDHAAYSLQGSPEGRKYPLFSKWNRQQRHVFEKYQWFFNVPVFGTSKFHLQLPAGQILPFLKVAPQAASSGYFGEVWKTIIHANNIKSSTSLPTFEWKSQKLDKNGESIRIAAVEIAVKKAREGDDDPNFNRVAFFDKEVENLNRLREYKSPHLIKPIAGYQIDQSRCLIFPWADGGNLGGYWEKYSLHARNKSNVLWQIGQFVGICSALEELHEPNVRHGDLKPENILWFDPKNNGGTLQIADLGLATFHEKEANTKNRKGMPTQTPSGTSRYEPPEMDEKRNTKDPRSRQYDIWSLGCVVLELLLWLAYSPTDLTTFRDQTPYFWQKGYRRGHKKYIVDEYVVTVMQILETHLEPLSAYKDLLDLVRDRLLVVQLSLDYVSVPGCRERAKEVHQVFENIYRKCVSDEGYLNPFPEKLQYPGAELHARAPQREELQRNEVHEKDGNLAVPGHQLVSKPALDTTQTLEQGPSEESSDSFRMTVRRPTSDLMGGTLNSTFSETSNHQKVCSSHFIS